MMGRSQILPVGEGRTEEPSPKYHNRDQLVHGRVFDQPILQNVSGENEWDLLLPESSLEVPNPSTGHHDP